MKRTIGAMGVIILSFLAVTATAQTPEPQPQPQPQPQSTWDPQKNPTVAAISAKYKDKMIPARPAATNEDIYPALGRFESATNADAANVTITLDETNRGIVWIDGLPQGRIKAMLRRSPAVYKIPEQKTEDGKEVKEGTLIFDKDMNTLSIVIGKEFNSADPAAVFAAPAPVEEEAVTKTKSKKSKTKKPAAPKAWVYTGTKVVVEKTPVVTEKVPDSN